MLLAGEMLIMLIMLIHIWDSWEIPEVDLTLLTLLTFPLPEAFFASHRGNVNNVNNVKSIFSKKMLLAGEMLIMLIMLIHIWDSWENPEVDLTLLTLLTVPLPEAFFASHRGNVNNVPNNGKCFQRLNQIFRTTSGSGFNIINIINISPARSIFCFPQGKC